MILSKQDWIDIFENAVSWVVVLNMMIYGLSKWVQFDGATVIDKSVSEMSGMELMWAFYGYSKIFALTIGFFEIVGSLLILIRKTRLLGCFFTSTILINIIIQDIIFEVHIGALRAAVIYQSLIFIILWTNKEKVVEGIRAFLLVPKSKKSGKKLLIMTLITLLAFVILRLLEILFTEL